MLVLADTTEKRNLPDSLKESCCFVSGMEDITGADLIITPLSIPSSNDALILRHAEAGVCIQRKTIGDFVQSITEDDSRLWFQLARLIQVCPLPWLLLIGDLKCTRENKAVIDGRESGWDYGKIIAALDWWQMRGGYMSWISREGLVASWCSMWATRLENRDSEGGWGKKVIFRPIAQTLYETPAVQRTLMTFPGLGTDRAEAVYQKTVERCNGERPTLMDTMLILQEMKVEGVGDKTRAKIMQYIGWEDGDEE